MYFRSAAADTESSPLKQKNKQPPTPQNLFKAKE